MVWPWQVEIHPSLKGVIRNLALCVRTDMAVTSTTIRSMYSVLVDENVKMNDSLRGVVDAGLLACLNDMHSKPVLDFMCELSAFLEFACVREGCCRLKTLESVHGTLRACAPAIRKRLVTIENTPTFNGRKWRSIRGFCMELTCAGKIMESDAARVFFYGGRDHALAILMLLQEAGYTESDTVDATLRFDDTNVFSCALQNGEQTIVLLGEHHNQTGVDFETKLVNTMRQLCASEDRTDFFVEKHMQSSREDSVQDTLQQFLSCSMNLSIHRIRCSSEFENCRWFNIHPIDTRHFDLGFLREEMLQHLSTNFLFLKKSTAFQNDCFEALRRQLKPCLTCTA